MSTERQLWITHCDVERPDHYGEYVELSDLNPGQLDVVTLETTDATYSEGDLWERTAPVEATEEEAREWAAAYEEFCAIVDRAEEALRAAEENFAQAVKTYRETATQAVENYTQRANAPIRARFEEMQAALDQAAQREAEERARQAAQQLADEDALLGPREWVIFRPQADRYGKIKASDALVPTVHRAACGVVKDKKLPLVRLEDVADAALTGAKEVDMKASSRFYGLSMTDRRLPVKWCGSCKAAQAALQALGSAEPKWRAEVEACVREAESNKLHNRPKIDVDTVKKLFTTMGLPLFAPGKDGEPSQEGFVVVSPCNGGRRLKRAERIEVRYWKGGGVPVDGRSLREGDFPEVQKSFDWAVEKAVQHGYLVKQDYALLTVRKMTQAEQAARKVES